MIWPNYAEGVVKSKPIDQSICPVSERGFYVHGIT